MATRWQWRISHRPLGQDGSSSYRLHPSARGSGGGDWRSHGPSAATCAADQAQSSGRLRRPAGPRRARCAAAPTPHGPRTSPGSARTTQCAARCRPQKRHVTEPRSHDHQRWPQGREVPSPPERRFTLNRVTGERPRSLDEFSTHTGFS